MPIQTEGHVPPRVSEDFECNFQKTNNKYFYIGKLRSLIIADLKLIHEMGYSQEIVPLVPGNVF